MPTALEQVGRVQAEDKDSERAERTHLFVITWSPNNPRDCYGIRIAKETVKQLQIQKASCQESGETSGAPFQFFSVPALKLLTAVVVYKRVCLYFSFLFLFLN